MQRLAGLLGLRLPLADGLAAALIDDDRDDVLQPRAIFADEGGIGQRQQQETKAKRAQPRPAPARIKPERDDDQRQHAEADQNG